MIINTSYFFGDLYVPQVTETQVANSLGKYINKYEPEFLQRVFGYEMAKNITDYTDIMNGKEYTQFGRLFKWNGLKIDIGGGKFSSIIANYVYAKYINDNMSYSTGSGEKIIEQTTSVTVSPAAKITRAWNEMVDEINSVIHFMSTDTVIYAAYHGTNRNLLKKMNAFGI